MSIRTMQKWTVRAAAVWTVLMFIMMLMHHGGLATICLLMVGLNYLIYRRLGKYTGV